MPLKYSPEGQVTGCHADYVPEARLCIKELKLNKEELKAQRKKITSTRPSADINRDEPIRRSEGIIDTIDRSIAQFDKAIVGLERHILSHSATPGSPSHKPPQPPASEPPAS